jgi:hypothetical protein
LIIPCPQILSMCLVNNDKSLQLPWYPSNENDYRVERRWGKKKNTRTIQGMATVHAGSYPSHHVGSRTASHIHQPHAFVSTALGGVLLRRLYVVRPEAGSQTTLAHHQSKTAMDTE